MPSLRHSLRVFAITSFSNWNLILPRAIGCSTIFFPGIIGMCGRYTLSRTEEISRRFGIDDDDVVLTARYNIAPEQIVPVVIRDDHNWLALMKWGLIPSWSKDAKSLAINARMEGILSKPSFRKPIRSHRCLVPATGFYEWKSTAGGKIPY